jgi:hypothetical protein
MSDTSDSDPAKSLIIRGRDIRFDENGLACLSDIWRAAGYSKTQQPAQWARLPGTLRKIERVLELVVGKSHNYDKADMHRVYRTYRGVGTYADIRLALDYAEYLNPKLAIEVKEVFLRYKAGDASLADEVLQRASADDNIWAANRALVRAGRLIYTQELKERGVVEPKHYAICTDTTYRNLFGKSAKELKAAQGLPANANLRDKLPSKDLAFLAASEALAVERMEEEESQGFTECERATGKAATSIHNAIEGDRRDRQKRLMG